MPQEQGVPNPSYCRWTVLKCQSAPSGAHNYSEEADVQTVIQQSMEKFMHVDWPLVMKYTVALTVRLTNILHTVLDL